MTFQILIVGAVVVLTSAAQNASLPRDSCPNGPMAQTNTQFEGDDIMMPYYTDIATWEECGMFL